MINKNGTFSKRILFEGALSSLLWYALTTRFKRTRAIYTRIANEKKALQELENRLNSEIAVYVLEAPGGIESTVIMGRDLELPPDTNWVLVKPDGSSNIHHVYKSPYQDNKRGIENESYYETVKEGQEYFRGLLGSNYPGYYRK